MNRFFTLITLAIIAFFGSGCLKVEDTIANVTVIRINSIGEEVPVDGAQVRLYANGPTDQDFVGEPRFDTTQVTSDDGFVSFNFSDYYVGGQAGFAVLDIDVIKGNGNCVNPNPLDPVDQNTLCGTGLIKIEEMETTAETVIVQ
ncbi:MAG: hypothetical protein CMB32_04980 [Euryarchaeota archaeon]|nr:hypothetical protein [Euryarchaeota archaeon]